MKTKSFFPSLGLLVALNLIIKPVWIFAIDRQVQNEIGTAQYGIYFSLLGLSVFLNFLLDWGFTIYFNRQLASDPENFTNRAGSFLLVKLLFIVFYASSVLLIAQASGIQRMDILLYVIIIQALTSIFVFLRSIVTAMQWFVMDAWLSVLDKALMIVLCGGFIYFPTVFGDISLEWFLYTQTACTLLAIIIVVIILLSKKISFRIKKPFPGKGVFKATLPFAVIILLMSTHYRADGFLLERLHNNGPYEAGVYAAAYRLMEASNMIGFLFASFLLPFISNRLSKLKNINWIVLNSRHLLIIFSLFISITVIFQAPWLQALLYHSYEANAIEVMQWCLPALIGYSLVHIYGTVLTARGQFLPFSYILLFSVALNIILNLFLIPEFGAKGCCISAVISQMFCGVAVMVFAWRKSAIEFHTPSLLIYVFIAGLVTGFYYLCSKLYIENYIVIGLAAVFTLALTLQFRMLDIKALQEHALQDE